MMQKRHDNGTDKRTKPCAIKRCDEIFYLIVDQYNF